MNGGRAAAGRPPDGAVDAAAMAAPAAFAPFPWAALTAFGLGVLRWPPEAFWAATPAELLAAAAAMAPADVAAPRRAALAALMARFPDAARAVDGGPGDRPPAG